MTYEPITKLEIENYGCIRKASFALSPLHAFIGPNDSGKSTALRALRTPARFAAGLFDWKDNSYVRPFDPMLDTASAGTRLSLRYGDGSGYRVFTAEREASGHPATARTQWAADTRECALSGNEQHPPEGQTRSWNHPGLRSENDPELARLYHGGRLSTATMVRFDPNALRKPAKQILAEAPIRFDDETGTGLASVYQAINSREVDAFIAIRDGVRKYFPTIQSILVPTIAENKVVLQARLTDGTVVPAPAMSEGLLYFLGYAALRYLSPSRLFLIEEPENGLHPARISEVMKILREISKESQSIIATHSPLVANELEGPEVSVVTRDPEKGTQAVLLAETPNYRERGEIYLNGELWVAYGDGCSEQALVQGGPRP